MPIIFCLQPNAIQAPALSNSLPDNFSAYSSPIIPALKSMSHCVTIMNHRVTINFELLKGTSNMMKYSTEWRTLFTGGDDVSFKGAHFAQLWDPTYPNLAVHCLLKKL